MIRWIKSSQGLNMLIKGESHFIPQSHVNYDRILKLLDNGTTDENLVHELTAEAIKRRIANYSGVDIEIRDGEIFFKNKLFDNEVLANKILDMIEQGYEAPPLLRFLEKVKANPEPELVTSLWDWLRHGGLAIADDGDLIGFKYVELVSEMSDRDERKQKLLEQGAIYTDAHSKTFNMTPGKLCEMPREHVDRSREVCSGPGLHVGTFRYVSGSKHVVLVKVNPSDVVVVPFAESEKLRCCRYLVLDKYDPAHLNDKGLSEAVYKVDGVKLSNSEFKRAVEAFNQAPVGELDNESAGHW